MPVIGLHCSHEQIAPSRLLAHVREAEAAGFRVNLAPEQQREFFGDEDGDELQLVFSFTVNNHDELTLDKLSEGERQEVFAAFGPEPELQLYGRGLRRRLPT